MKDPIEYHRGNDPVDIFNEYRNEFLNRLQQFSIQAVGSRLLICHYTSEGVECKKESESRNLKDVVLFAVRHIAECEKGE